MAHIHGVVDKDKHFVIDAATREITNQSEKITLMQNDHNSERFTFEIPKEVDGHDMSLCNVVQVHYMNIDASTKTQNPGVYDVEDLQISPDDENTVIGSWLISSAATKYVGNLNFIFRFMCVAADGSIEYAWSSAIFKGISVGQSYNNTDAVAEEYADILVQWQARIEALEQGGTGTGSGSGHTHENKAVLDRFGINGANVRPTFNNGLSDEVLATQADVTSRVNLHKAETAELYYSKKEIDEKGFITTDDLPEGDGLTEEQAADLAANTEARHTHENKSVLDLIERSATDIESLDYNGKMLALWQHVPRKTSQLTNDSGFITADDIPEIPEDDFSQFIEETASSVNLYPPTTDGWTNNATLKSDGSENPNASGAYCITPPISVLPNTTYTIKPVPWGGLTDANRGRAYSENGMALAKLGWVENADGTISFTTPENASYIRFTVYKTNFDNSDSNITDINIIIPIFNSVFMLVKGTTAPEVYEPYGKGDYRLKNIEIPEKSVKLSKVDDETLPIFAPLAGKKIANFGDSIFGNARPPEDVSTYLAKKAGAEVLNCAFGGCRMSQHVGHWDAFSMYRLAYAIANNDYSLQDEALNYDDRTSYAAEPLALIKATDFSTVDILTVGYGTNDYTGNNTLDNSENPLDTSTVCGALRYSIEQLLTAYPNLRIVILSLTYRFWADDNNVYTEDSNSRANGKGDTILNYNAKLKEVAEEYNLPFIDNYNIGIGKFNRTQYFSATDGTHHQIEGRKLIAEHLAKELY